MTNKPEVKVVEIRSTDVWIENDSFGGRHVMLQHQGLLPFTYATFNYNYSYTDNAGTWAAAHDLAVELGATEPVEQRFRDYRAASLEPK